MRAYQKRVLLIKNTDSKIFEEAYFIVKPTADTKGLSKSAMTREADRIIAESLGEGRINKRLIVDLLLFAGGAALALLISLLF